jgi:hypothetical protein
VDDQPDPTTPPASRWRESSWRSGHSDAFEVAVDVNRV